MVREFARMNTAIWNDDDFRDLPQPVQGLYKLLWTHPALSYCGTLEWRPGRLAQFSAGLDGAMVRTMVDCLRARQFVVVDDDTEELLIRSWVRWDGLMKQPRLAVSYANAVAAVASNTIRGVLVDELTKLEARDPGLAGFRDPRVRSIMDQRTVAANSLPEVADPFALGFKIILGTGLGVEEPMGLGTGLGQGLGQTDPKVSGSVSIPPTTATTTSSSSIVGARKRGTRLPDGWIPSESVRDEMRAEYPHVDLRTEHAKFCDYWHSKAGSQATKIDWDKTWRNWIRTAADRSPRQHLQAVPSYETPPAPEPDQLPWAPA